MRFETFLRSLPGDTDSLWSKRPALRCWLPVLTLVIAALLLQSPAPAQSQGESEIQRGFQIAPVPLNLTNKNRGLAGLGSYLVNTECVGCHTPNTYLPGNNPFLGETPAINTEAYLAGGTPFGPFVSRNLTPDRFGRPAGLTLLEFIQVMRFGTDIKAIPPPVGGNPGLLQVMPWPLYSSSTIRDLEAMYEYLSSIPCKEGGPGMPIAPALRC